jgi:hypothetical protein
MPNGYSLHIGLNHVDPAGYHGWDGQLAGCLNDARAMKAICDAQGFTSRILLDGQATAAAVLAAISDLATRARTGDTVVISYSGHGGQVPDTTGTEDDGLSETWVCFDRMVVDKELYALWSQFPRNAHVEVYSDSCHSGTVIRELMSQGGKAPMITNGAAHLAAETYTKTVAAKPPSGKSMPTAAAKATVTRNQAAFNTVFSTAFAQGTQPVVRAMPERFIPAALALQLFREQPVLQQQKKAGPIECGVVLISGCQDNQTSADGTNNGLFTEKLLQVWDAGAFQGTLPQFHKAIVALMPSDQTPNYFLVGLDDDAISNGRPLSVLDAGASASATPPTITAASDTLTRDGSAPTFDLDFGTGRNGVVEVTTDTACFGNTSLRTADNFYGTWSDSARLHNSSWMLPDAVWSRLKVADRLYYRAGSTTSETGWDDYLASTPDPQAASAPSISITGDATAQPVEDDPAVHAPASWPRASSTPPSLTVETTAPYHIIEIATNTSLFANTGARSADTFYGSWQDPNGRLTTPEFTLPSAVWTRLRSSDRLYYRAGTTTSASGWDNYRVSTPDSAAASAPSLALT